MKHILTDFDGTLVDSLWNIREAYSGLFRDKKMPFTEETLNRIMPMGIPGAAEFFVREMGMPATPDEVVDEIHNRMFPAYHDRIFPKPFVMEYLTKMHAEGVHFHLLSAGSPAYLEPCLANNHMTEFFDHNWTCEGLGMSKGDPAIYTRVAEMLGVPVCELTMFDDNRRALETAVKAGVYTVAVYDEASADDEAYLTGLVDRYIHSFEELL